MRQHVIGCSQVGGQPPSHEIGRHCAAEKLLYRFNTLLPRRFGSAGSWLDAQTRNAAFLGILQQITVVRRNLHNMRRTIQHKSHGHLVHIGLRMCEPTVGE